MQTIISGSVISWNYVNLKRNVKELDENDQGEVEVRISGQRGGGKRHPEIGHAAKGTKIASTSHYERDTGRYVALNPNIMLAAFPVFTCGTQVYTWLF